MAKTVKIIFGVIVLIYVGAAFCDNDENAMHECGEKLRNSMLHRLGLDGTNGVAKAQNGRPFYKNGDVDFSVSHSAGVCVCAVAVREKNRECPDNEFVLDVDTCAVGIDIEPLDGVRNREKIAKKYFTFSEKEYVGDSRERFFEVWTAKEALCKLTGEGLGKISAVDSKNLPQNVRLVTEHRRFGNRTFALSLCYKILD